MDKLRSTMDILVGVILGFANGLGFRNVSAGIIMVVCYSVLFAFIFNKYRHNDKSEFDF